MNLVVVVLDLWLYSWVWVSVGIDGDYYEVVEYKFGWVRERKSLRFMFLLLGRIFIKIFRLEIYFGF